MIEYSKPITRRGLLAAAPYFLLSRIAANAESAEAYLPLVQEGRREYARTKTLRASSVVFERFTELDSERKNRIINNVSASAPRTIQNPNGPKFMLERKGEPRISYSKEHWFIPEDEDYANKIIALSERGISHALKLWEIPVPQHEFKIPKEKNDFNLDLETSDLQVFYVINAFGATENLIITQRYESSLLQDAFHEQIIRQDIGIQLPLEHFRTRKINFQLGSDGEVYANSRTLLPIMALNRDVLYTIRKPPNEVLDLYIYRQVLTHMCKEIKDSLNRDTKIDPDKAQKIRDKWWIWENAFVQAMTGHWLERYNDYYGLGFTRREIEVSTGNPKALELTRRIRSRGPKWALDTLESSPSVLFGENYIA